MTAPSTTFPFPVSSSPRLGTQNLCVIPSSHRSSFHLYKGASISLYIAVGSSLEFSLRILVGIKFAGGGTSLSAMLLQSLLRISSTEATLSSFIYLDETHLTTILQVFNFFLFSTTFYLLISFSLLSSLSHFLVFPLNSIFFTLPSPLRTPFYLLSLSCSLSSTSYSSHLFILTFLLFLLLTPHSLQLGSRSSNVPEDNLAHVRREQLRGNTLDRRQLRERSPSPGRHY